MESISDLKQPISPNHNHTKERCVSFDDFKKALGDKANEYTDESIEKIRIAFEQLADITFDGWLKEANGSMILENKDKIL